MLETNTTTESFSHLFEESNLTNNSKVGSLLLGTVIDINREKAIVNVGLKSEGFISINEFKDDRGELEIKQGDIVEVVLKSIDDGLGNTLLSHTDAKSMKEWTVIESAMEAKDTITGKISAVVKGGLTFEIGSIMAFLPGSLVDVHPVKDLSSLMGQDVEVLIIKADKKRNSIVVSRKAAMRESNSAGREELLLKIKVGAELSGTITGLANYGAFVDLGGVDGLLHISDIAWSRLKHPSEKLTVGEKLTVKILKYDAEKGRVSLGLKQLTSSPWENILDHVQVGTIATGTISSVADFGVFVKVADGVEGLVHVSEMNWSGSNVIPSSLYKAGDEVKVSVLEVQESKRRLSLSIKQAQESPWISFESSHNDGDKLNVVVRKVTEFGIFVSLPGGIDGLIHISDVSNEKITVEALFSEYTKGLELEVMVLSMSAEKERISLGIKQLQENPKEESSYYQDYEDSKPNFKFGHLLKK